MDNFDPKSLIDLDQCVLNALDLFMDPATVFPKPNLAQFKRPLVVGSGNALRRSALLRRAAEEVFGMDLALTPGREEAAAGAARLARELAARTGPAAR